MRRPLALIGAALLAMLAAPDARAQNMPPLDTFKQMANAAATQWVAFRDFNGRQLVYFSAVVSYACGLSEIRWSMNTDSLDQNWPMPKCNEYLPFSIDADSKIYETLKLNTAKTISIQLVFKDGTATDTYTYAPCPGVGEATCSRRVETPAVAAAPAPCEAPCTTSGAAGGGGTGAGARR